MLVGGDGKSSGAWPPPSPDLEKRRSLTFEMRTFRNPDGVELFVEKLFMMQKVQCMFCFENCTTERRGGERGGSAKGRWCKFQNKLPERTCDETK